MSGTDRNDAIDVSGDASELEGERPRGDGQRPAHRRPATDRLDINTGAGKDIVDSAGLAAGAIELFVNGVLVP